ncbi:MAG: CHAT domain-containing protein [Chloroflexi bacterium]|nr:CHAT domain-containing protein [Chloroflexota bacterium]
MAISQARMAEWNCIGCGVVTPALMWLAVDAVERPDLVAQVSDLLEFECPSCCRPFRRFRPLLVLRLANVAPVIVACASDDEPDPLESLREVVATAQRALGDALRDVPGPAIIVTFDELEAGVRGDLDTDVGASEVNTGGCEPDYVRLLDKIDAVQAQQRLEVGLEQLALVGSEDQLREVVERFPEIITDEAEQFVERRQASAPTEEGRRFASSMLQTVQFCRRGDSRGAWSVREWVIRSFWEETVLPRLSAFEEVKRDATSQQLAQVGKDLLAVLVPGAHPELEMDATVTTMVALLEGEGVNRGEPVEYAIELGERALWIMEAHPELDHPQGRLQVATNLSGALGMRSRGDPVSNLTQGITCLIDALDQFPRDLDRDNWALAQTNLALLLVNRGEAGDHDRAREHLRLALTHRSRRRNPRDWAYTQANLAVVLSRSESGDRRANLRRAIRHSTKARNAARSSSDTRLLAQIAHNLASEQFELSQMEGFRLRRQSRLLDRAEASATEAVELSAAAASPLQNGRAWLIIARVRSARGDSGGAIEAARTALTSLPVETVPADARDASRFLMEVAQEHDDVDLAADAAGRLVEAAAAAISAHSAATGRISQHLGTSSTDFRFAAHALVRAQRVEDAVVALERGRARELGLLTLTERLDLDALSHLDPTLRARIEEIGASFRADILGLEELSASDRADEYERIRSAVQQTPIFETSLDPPTLSEISQAAQPRCPLVYLGSAPTGSFAIIVDKHSDGSVELDAIHAPACTSTAIVELAMIGISPDTPELEVSESAYLLAQMNAPEELDASLAALSPLIGEHLLRPLDGLLASRGSAGVTLVPTGLLGLMPMHAIAWSDASGNRRCLVDDFAVTFAPSAQLQVACMQRASQRSGDPIRFVGVANPLPHPNPLPGAELEIELVQGLVPTGECLTLRGAEATKQRVMEVLPSATHVHFACHASARFFDPRLSAAISLSDEEELAAIEIARHQVPARLVVASACETGVLQGYDAIDESLGLASAFIAAGAAGVVSTLWAVDDFAAALIVSKLYQGIFVANKSPAEALREAQLWVRNASDDAIDAYTSSRAPLRALRGTRHSPGASDGSPPHASPSCWAGFAFSGA